MTGVDPGQLRNVIDQRWPAALQPRPVPRIEGVEHWLVLQPDPRAFSVHVVPFVGDDVILIRPVEGVWEMPGGRLEAGESIAVAAERELAEEAGVEPRSPIHAFATIWFRWLPPAHAAAERPVAVTWCNAEVVGDPTNPDGETATAEVAVISVAQACDRLDAAGSAVLAACYHAAAVLRAGG